MLKLIATALMSSSMVAAAACETQACGGCCAPAACAPSCAAPSCAAPAAPAAPAMPDMPGMTSRVPVAPQTAAAPAYSGNGVYRSYSYGAPEPTYVQPMRRPARSTNDMQFRADRKIRGL